MRQFWPRRSTGCDRTGIAVAPFWTRCALPGFGFCCLLWRLLAGEHYGWPYCCDADVTTCSLSFSACSGFVYQLALSVRFKRTETVTHCAATRVAAGVITRRRAGGLRNCTIPFLFLSFRTGEGGVGSPTPGVHRCTARCDSALPVTRSLYRTVVLR